MPKRMISQLRRPLILAIALAVVADEANAITITVNDSGDSASPAGCTLRGAVTAVNAGAFAGSDPCSTSSSGSFGTNDTVLFDSALAGTTITLQQGQLSFTNPLSIAGSGQTINGNALSRIFNVTSTLNASSLTLTNGSAVANGSAAYVTGAASSLTLNHITVSGNNCVGSALAGGGGSIFASKGASLTLTNSSVTSNSSTLSTPGVYLYASTATLTDSTISGNSGTCSTLYCSGALYVAKSTALVNGSTLSGNSESGYIVAGAVYDYGGAVSLVNSTIAGNSASGDHFAAGALLENHVSNPSAGLTLTNTTLSANTASSTNAAAPYVSGGILIGSFSGVHGSLTATNSIVSGNSATGGSAPTPDIGANSSASLTINVTFSLLGTALNVSPYNAAANSNVFSDAPGLAPLQLNGGRTQTMSLLAGSPAIDSGSNSLAVDAGGQPLLSDQTGFVRVYNGTVDMGAFEYPGDHIFGNSFE